MKMLFIALRLRRLLSSDLGGSCKYCMNQYHHTPSNRKPTPIKEEKASYAEQQLMETVRRLALLTDQQGRQIRRLETQLEQLRESVVQRGRP